MKIKAIVMTAMFSLLLSQRAFASSEASNIITFDKDMNMIKIENSQYTSGKSKLLYINNADSSILYKPEYKEISKYEYYLKDVTDYNMFLIDPFTVLSKSRDIPSNKKVYETLGYDIDITEDSYNLEEYVPYKASQFGRYPTRAEMIMAMYKTMNQNINKVYMNTYRSMSAIMSRNAGFNAFTLPDKSNEDMSITGVFVTRTNKDYYIKESIKDNLYFDADEDSEYYTKTITYAEFCKELSILLDLKGEPVLNDTEKKVLLSVYGKNLPIDVDKNERDAIEYLIARGIIDPTKNKYRDKLTTELMLDILTRVKDTKARLNFKTITIPYNEDLVNKGFALTSLKSTKSTISNISIKTNKSAVDYCDYLIKVVSNSTSNSKSTVFRDKNNRIVNNLYISKKYDDISKGGIKDSEYLGIEDGYYHFRIPIISEQESKTVANGKTYYTLNSSALSDLPENILIEEGGGKYEECYKEGKHLYMNRSSFLPTDKSILVDKERKIKDVVFNTSKIYLTSDQETVFTFKCDDISSLLFDGKLLTDSTNKDIFKDLGSKCYQLTLKGRNAYKDLLSALTLNKEGSEMPAYIQDDNTILVPLSYLKKHSAVREINEIEKGKFILISETQNALVDTVNRIIVSGQTVTEVPKTDTSPLIVYDESAKDYFIDYRAVIGFTNGFLILKDSSGAVTITDEPDRLTLGHFGNMYTMLGMSEGLPIEFMDSTKLCLEHSYALANYIVYRSRNKNADMDYLLVFKPKTDKNSTDTKVVNQLKDLFGIALSDDETCSIFTLSSNIVYQDKSIKQASRVSYVDNLGYVFDIPEASNFNYNKYLNGTDESNPIPIVQLGTHSFLNLNLNYMNDNIYPSRIRSSSSNVNIDGITFKDSDLDMSRMIAAPTGVQARFYPFSKFTWKDVMSLNNKTIFFGTMKGDIKEDIDASYSFFKFKVLDYSVCTIPVDTSDNSLSFIEISRGSNSSVFIYDTLKLSKVTNLNTDTHKDASKIFDLSNLKNILDWKSIHLKDMFNSIDDFLTILIIILLNVVVRFFCFDFFAIAALGMVSDARIVRYFCEKVADPYKILSAGLISIDTIDKKSIWISTTAGTILLSMLQRESLIMIADFIVKFIMRIFNY